MTAWRAVAGGLDLHLRVQPRARRAGIEGLMPDGARLRVSVTAPPEDGRANDAVCRLLAEALGLAPSHVRLRRGGTSREKTFRLEGEAEALARALAALASP